MPVERRSSLLDGVPVVGSVPSGPSRIGVYPTRPVVAVEAVPKAPGRLHSDVVQGREVLVHLSGHPVGNMNIVLDHGQGGVSEALLQQEYVAAVQKETGGVGVAHQMRVQPRDPSGLGEPLG